ncbi:virB8 family protein [Luteimonas mephitis]|uniref:virB8 family protein n=1 Tax=Luteimonas mephitis TaxID=83615 RepID=UPI000683E1EC|nr:type IV secretion system protein [Luteimonas mephitis]
MKLSKKTATPNIDNIVSRSVNFEVTVADLARRSERRAWWVAFSAILMALILACGYFLMLPLKEKVPYLVMADAYTGTSTVARLRGDFASNQITAQEAINRSNVSHYVLARESYDSVLLGLRDWVTVYAMSAGNIAGEYRAQFSADNPMNPRKLYGTSQAVRVKISSIVLTKDGSGAPRGATVRIERRVVNKGNGSSNALDNKIITMLFSYKNNLKMDDRYRIENPLGFQVTGYRVDNDYSTASPIQPLSSSMDVDPTVAMPAAEVFQPEDAAPPAPEYGDGTATSDAHTNSTNGAATR